MNINNKEIKNNKYIVYIPNKANDNNKAQIISLAFFRLF